MAAGPASPPAAAMAAWVALGSDLRAPQPPSASPLASQVPRLAAAAAQGGLILRTRCAPPSPACAIAGLAVVDLRRRRRRHFRGQQQRRRAARQAVAEEMWHKAPQQAAAALPPEWIIESFRTNARLTGLLWLLSAEDMKATIHTMFPQAIEAGECVIEEGSVGTTFYIIEKGSFEVFESHDDVPFPGIKVGELGPGDSFGELALLYSKVRSATVVATSPARLWVMERAAFQNAVSKGFDQQLPAHFLKFLEGVPLFKGIEGDRLMQLGRALLPRWFGKGQNIIRKGEWEECFYILRTGEAAAFVQLPEGEQQIEHFTAPGSVIGGEVLLQKYRGKSQINVKSLSEVTVAFWMSKLSFDNIMGECKDEALKNMVASRRSEECVCM